MLSEDKRERLISRLEDEFPEFYELAGGKNYRYHHLLRVHRYVLKLMESEEVGPREFDPEVVEVAALFHDVGRIEDIEDGRMDPFEGHDGHPERGAEMVGDMIDEFLEQGQVEKVEKVIRNHHSEAETVEGMIVQDADSIGGFGVLNLWRMIHYGADKGRPMEDMFDYFWSKAVKQLSGRLEDLNFNVSRRVAEKRLQEYKELVSLMEIEDAGDDIA